ncbi:MAG TPA: peptidoglycan-binding protein [Oscillatoriales cyanobacterium M59_W2019_021]|nr:MAG: hydrolase [Cyanobacteria bacterium J055]HIK31727.1 peptidoglycan-binding protein [Oscillatoriales cyanobacterium M4454_W2019_049]HIK49646.1 peptidoglycan-binding protein [Oscillatoriales cyanobacterium M59_W2019_021]
MSVRGIEVSDAQGTVDWQAVAAGGMAYAVTQATEGAEGIARTFGKNWDAIKAVGLVRGASHVFRSTVDAQSQADRFLETVGLEPGDLPPVLQILPDENPAIETLLAWLNRIERATQRSPILQTHREFWTRIDNPEALTCFPLWIVDRSILSIPRLPRGISDWWFWEYGNRDRIAGILTEVRASWFNSCQEGATGDLVRTAQQRLQDRGFAPGNLDGSFDLLTEAAVRQFQRSIDLPEDGILGPRTWAHLMAAPTAVAAVQPLSTLTSNSIQLVSVGQYYQAVPQQTQALDWLQNQLKPETIGEFARRWRQQPTVTASIRLVDAAVYYQGSAHQIQAFNWLQQQIPPAILEEFAGKWRAAPPPTINLIDVARYYQGLPAQAQALDWLQARVSGAALVEFARQWRNQPTRTSSPIRLVDAAAYYKGEPYQNQAWIWLQRQVSEAALGEFARQWRAAPPLPMRLENVAQYYQGLPYQEAALRWLQEQIPSSIFQEFARRWRG